MLNRLLAIIYILMNKGTVTASELAQRFEVSVRTIYRDIDALCMAGIPVYTRKGKNGGISLTEQFVLNKMLVSRREQQEILAALLSLKETGAADEDDTLRKLGEFFSIEPANWVSIDFSDWSGRRQELFGELKKAVIQRNVIEFDYYGQYGEMSHRSVEPIQLQFKEYTWYLRAFCRQRKAVRLFKILRMKRVKCTQECFLPEEGRYAEGKTAVMQIPEEGGGYGDSYKSVCLELLIDAGEAYRVYDRFEEEELTRLDNGEFMVRMQCIPDEWLYGLILSFGAAARVVQPEEIKGEIRNRLKKMLRQYEA